MKLKVVQTPAGPWYAGGLKFTCTQCGNCCTGGPGYVWISDEEIQRLAAHLQLPAETVIERYCRKVGGQYSLKENRNARGEYDCVFLKEEPIKPDSPGAITHGKRTCTVYPVRPLQCRTWPFWDGLLGNQENWERASLRCHGMNQGRTWTRAEMEALRDARDWPKDAPGSGKKS